MFKNSFRHPVKCPMWYLGQKILPTKYSLYSALHPDDSTTPMRISHKEIAQTEGEGALQDSRCVNCCPSALTQSTRRNENGGVLINQPRPVTPRQPSLEKARGIAARSLWQVICDWSCCCYLWTACALCWFWVRDHTRMKPYLVIAKSKKGRSRGALSCITSLQLVA